MATSEDFRANLAEASELLPTRAQRIARSGSLKDYLASQDSHRGADIRQALRFERREVFLE